MTVVWMWAASGIYTIKLFWKVTELGLYVTLRSCGFVGLVQLRFMYCIVLRDFVAQEFGAVGTPWLTTHLAQKMLWLRRTRVFRLGSRDYEMTLRSRVCGVPSRESSSFMNTGYHMCFYYNSALHSSNCEWMINMPGYQGALTRPTPQFNDSRPRLPVTRLTLSRIPIPTDAEG